jgi:NAD+ kinase
MNTYFHQIPHYRHTIVTSSWHWNHLETLREYAQSEVFLDQIGQLREETIIVLGGDGTLYRAIHAYHVEQKPFLGIRFGTKGFLLHDPMGLHLDRCTKYEIPFLNGTLTTEDTSETFSAIGDIYLKHQDSGKMMNIVVAFEAERHHVFGDGLVISTPFGSTGYNRNAG